MATKKTLTEDAWIKAIEDDNARLAQPPNSKTLFQLMEKGGPYHGLPATTVFARIRKLVKQGKVKMVNHGYHRTYYSAV